jgi:uncharacterized damage-inducible protein DinB
MQTFRAMMRTTGMALNGAGAFGTVRLRGDMSKPEVWQRGPLPGVDPLLMPVAHAFVQVQEDLRSLAATTAADAVWQRPGGAASIAFHVRHIGGATDRLLTYARGAALSDAQRTALQAEGDESPPRSTLEQLVDETVRNLDAALAQVRATTAEELFAPRTIGRAALPTTVLGLLFHAAEHATRHAGQAITTARVQQGAF